MSTESTLRDWRYGQVQAERMCAALLSIEGFSSVDPQHPLGGPDGIKDVLCQRGVSIFVAAAYFPTGPVTFSAIKKKFSDDLRGVAENSSSGFVFLTNQALTAANRKTLRSTAGDSVTYLEIYHSERLRNILDSPLGCGVRLEYLRIAMSHEEQIAFWSSANVDLAARLDRVESLQVRTLQQLHATSKDMIARTTSLFLNLTGEPSSAGTWPVQTFAGTGGPATSSIDVPTLLWFHRILMMNTGMHEALRGNLRTLEVSVKPASPKAEHIFTPPSPESIRDLLSNWCDRWRTNYPIIAAARHEDQLIAIAGAYHEFLAIHPFSDGNGRMARMLLDQMLRELVEARLPSIFVENIYEHQTALQLADAGNLTLLTELISLAIT